MQNARKSQKNLVFCTQSYKNHKQNKQKKNNFQEKLIVQFIADLLNTCHTLIFGFIGKGDTFRFLSKFIFSRPL